MDWIDLAMKYPDICFFYTNKKGNLEIKPVDEWLDDVYLKLTKEQAISLIEDIYNNGATLFQYYTDARQSN